MGAEEEQRGAHGGGNTVVVIREHHLQEGGKTLGVQHNVDLLCGKETSNDAVMLIKSLATR